MRPRAHVLVVSCLCAATCPSVRSFLCEGPLCVARRFTCAGDFPTLRDETSHLAPSLCHPPVEFANVGPESPLSPRRQTRHHFVQAGTSPDCLFSHTYAAARVHVSVRHA